MQDRQQESASGERVVLREDEGHLLWGDTLGSIWGRMNAHLAVPSTNEKARQTSDGAINLATKTCHGCPFPKGESASPVKFVKHLQALSPRAKVRLMWDGASDHQSADLQASLQQVKRA